MRIEPKTLHGQESQLLHVFINEWMSEFMYLFYLLYYKLRTLGHLAGPYEISSFLLIEKSIVLSHLVATSLIGYLNLN